MTTHRTTSSPPSPPSSSGSRQKKSLAQVLQRNLTKYWQLYILLTPTILYFIIFRYVPMYGLQIAFRDYVANLGFFGSPAAGLKHFQRFFNTPDFWMILRNTLTISLTQLICTFPLPIILAFMLNQQRNQRRKSIVQNILIAPHFISLVVLIGMVTIFLNPTSGIFNTLLEMMGQEKIFFLGDPDYFRPIYILSGVWQSTGWATVIYTAALSGIDPTLYEAATVDGANRWQKMWNIDFFGILPVIIVQLILSAGTTLSVGYEKVLLLQNALNRSVSEVISTFEYQQGILSANFSYSTAIGLFNSVINLTILLMVNHLAKKYTDSSVL